jgi:hypothetical protein
MKVEPDLAKTVVTSLQSGLTSTSSLSSRNVCIGRYFAVHGMYVLGVIVLYMDCMYWALLCCTWNVCIGSYYAVHGMCVLGIIVLYMECMYWELLCCTWNVCIGRYCVVHGMYVF